ncbi:MAG TPA: DUF1653 domain-containing protein [Candidatus Saccharimonadales bacterium]|nr:DUF1653 domain-containing protein [Candidatus Saccharimonadales bacterium]
MKDNYPEFKAGVYRHYKGPHYLVLGIAHDSNYEDRIVVVYIGLELDLAKEGPRLATRTYEDFYAWVDPSNGEAISKNEPGAKKRFEFIGNSLDNK